MEGELAVVRARLRWGADVVERINISLGSGAIAPTRPLRKEDLEHAKEAIENYGLQPDQPIKAKYKLEVHFGPDRSSLHHKLMAALVTIWESGRRLHGGGDEKMYWCGYDDCGKPFSTDNFSYMHAVCPKCLRELMLDPYSRQEQIDYLKREGRSSEGIEKLPIVVGEKLMKQAPPAIASFLAKTWHALECHADIYLKFHPKDIRIDKAQIDHKVFDKVNLAHAKREPLIYPLGRILKDTTAGGDLEANILAMITA